MFAAKCGRQFFLSNVTRPIQSGFTVFGPNLFKLKTSTLTNSLGSRFGLRFLRSPVYRNRKPDNTIKTATFVALGAMGVTHFASPYLFQLPGLDHFAKNPSHLVYSFLGINCAVFGLWKMPQYYRLLSRYALLPKDHIYNKWSLIGSAFSHQEVWHLGMNMLALWSFGTGLANMIGVSNFFSLYVNSALAASLASIWYPYLVRSALLAPSLGASGALFGVFGAFSWLIPNAKIMMFVFPIPGGAWMAFLGSVAWNAAGVVMRWGSFDYAAHLGGSLAGAFYGWIISERVRKEMEKRRSLFRF